MSIVVERVKRCSRCAEEKPLDGFPKDARKPDGTGYTCKACRNRDQIERLRTNPERAERRRTTNLRWELAHKRERRWKGRGVLFQGEPLKKSVFLRLLELQGGVCAICGRKPAQRNVHADHDWSTGELRGVLDPRCNGQLIPLIEEVMQTEDAAILCQLGTASRIGRAVAYVLNPPAKRFAEVLQETI